MIPGITASMPIGASGPTDPFWAFVVMLIEGMTNMIDARGHSVIPTGAAIGTSVVPGGAVEMTGTANGKVLVTAVGTEFAPGSGPFCAEMFVSIESPETAYGLIFDTSGNGSAANGFFLENSSLRGLFFAETNSGFQSLAGAFRGAGVFGHVFVDRDASNVVRIGAGGTIIAKSTIVALIANTVGRLAIGGEASSTGVVGINGAWNNARYTVGASRYTGNVADPYTVPALPYPTH